jgi:hypothetical protein
VTDEESIKNNVEKLGKCDCETVTVTLELSDADREKQILKGVNNRSN